MSKPGFVCVLTFVAIFAAIPFGINATDPPILAALVVVNVVIVHSVATLFNLVRG
jgi:hypothetical protein